MTRRESIPLIEEAITTDVWRKYWNPALWPFAVNIPDTLSEVFSDAVPDFMDRMQFVAWLVKKFVEGGPVELIDAPTAPGAEMGQVEIHLTRPATVSPCVIFYKGEFWVREKEFFPFGGPAACDTTDAAPPDGGGIAGQIHYYDVDPAAPGTGWIHYRSRVPGWEDVEARVADVVRRITDVSADTLGFLPGTVPPGRPTPPVIRQLAEEAVRVSLSGPTWLQRIMMRDRGRWRARDRALYRKQRRRRRQQFEGGTPAFENPSVKQTD